MNNLGQQQPWEQRAQQQWDTLAEQRARSPLPSAEERTARAVRSTVMWLGIWAGAAVLWNVLGIGGRKR